MLRFPRLSMLFVALGLTVPACGGGGTLNPIDLSTNYDLSGPTAGDMATGGGGDMGGNGCNGVYSKSTIAAMRQGSPACYELDNVVTIAITPTTSTSKSVTIYAQDAAGGDYSAEMFGCSSSSTSHPCPAFTTAKAILTGRSVTITGLYIKSAATKGGFEEFYIDSITDNAAGTVPTPAAVALTDIERGGNKTADWFQMVTTTIAPADKLVMFDWTPPEFTGTGSCPQYGFGMLPMSATGTASAACTAPVTTTSTQPAGQAAVNAAEVMVGTDFYQGFTYTTDCACSAKYTQPLPTVGQGVSGAITVLLNYDVPYMATTGYQFIDPIINTSFMIQ
jgi:hypothetical protein